MTLDKIIDFRTTKQPKERDITRRLVVAQMRDKWRDPMLNAGDCLVEYEKLATRECQEYISTLTELNARSALLRIEYWLAEARKHLKG